MQYALESTDPFAPDTRHVAIVSGGLSEPSSTSKLAQRLAEQSSQYLSQAGIRMESHTISLRGLARDITDSLLSTSRSAELNDALSQVEQADGIIAVSPTFKASYSGLFKSFFDLVEDGAVTNIPALLGATGGTARHSLMIDQSMRPLFSYLKTRIIPTAVFAATEDWGSTDSVTSADHILLSKRIDSAAQDFSEVVGRLPARVRRFSQSAPAFLEVTPFEQLLDES